MATSQAMDECEGPLEHHSGIVMERYITPSNNVMCCERCANKLRAIDNASGRQIRATDPPVDNGAFQ